ncbi:MAG: hypothetical protein HY841_01135 [Bacteroidetes bacterium]|nr:hypothetical protein [Bacteroidota bacterium]
MKKIKKVLFIISIFSLLTLYSCKKVRNEEMTVIKDCTGVYLRFNNNDYTVCNLDMVSSFPDGATVTATFKKIKSCSDPGQSVFVCTMDHPNKGWIEVEKIK